MTYNHTPRRLSVPYTSVGGRSKHEKAMITAISFPHILLDTRFVHTHVAKEGFGSTRSLAPELCMHASCMMLGFGGV